ncbi:MAG: UDP-3-O-acyl-N-acetylglucosamine deacetylase [Campylobacterales bacterium]|nr:UDP-3-O-acyl-N-acetylglucosamine deacetylase [Campylobacterales bacterium]
MYQKTIKKAVQIVGIGLHKGVPVKLRLEPLEANSGIVFYREDLAKSIELKPSSVIDTTMATVIGNSEFFISTIEHMLSAIYAYGIDNLRIVLNNDEIPIMDGSSIGFCMLLDEAGVIDLDSFKNVIMIKKDVLVSEGEKFVKLSPNNYTEYSFKIKFDHPVIQTQSFDFSFSKKSYINEIARARTFGFLKEVQYLRSKNLALGGSLDNAIVLDDKKVLNSDGLRFENEFVRHKILDAIGDLSLLQKPFLGKYSSLAGSHKLNHLLTLELLKDSSNYEIVSVKNLYKELNINYEQAYC